MYVLDRGKVALSHKRDDCGGRGYDEGELSELEKGLGHTILCQGYWYCLTESQKASGSVIRSVCSGKSEPSTYSSAEGTLG